MEHFRVKALFKIKDLGRCEFEVSKAWYLKELFRHFWTYRDKGCAQRYFEYWEKEVASSGVEEVKKVARMLRRHLTNILTYFDSYITNASEYSSSVANFPLLHKNLRRAQIFHLPINTTALRFAETIKSKRGGGEGAEAFRGGISFLLSHNALTCYQSSHGGERESHSSGSFSDRARAA